MNVCLCIVSLSLQEQNESCSLEGGKALRNEGSGMLLREVFAQAVPAREGKGSRAPWPARKDMYIVMYVYMSIHMLTHVIYIYIHTHTPCIYTV